jgi:sulfite dehydrogenase (quinone) subunit SoeB
MTSLPLNPSPKKLGLVIDLDTCVGCQACATSCKEWNAQGDSGPLTDTDPQGKDVTGPWLNRIHGYEVKEQGRDDSRIVNFPRSCLHCDEPACVTVCPTGASYKRAEDGIVLINPDTCIGCKLCSWACPYGAREYDYTQGVMKKCTLCVDRIYNTNLEPEDQVPACVKACPTGARHFGDLGDASSIVAVMTFYLSLDTSPPTNIYPLENVVTHHKRTSKSCQKQMVPQWKNCSSGPINYSPAKAHPPQPTQLIIQVS